MDTPPPLNKTIDLFFTLLLSSVQDVIKLNDPGDKEFVASRDINNFIHLQAREENKGRDGGKFRRRCPLWIFYWLLYYEHPRCDSIGCSTAPARILNVSPLL